MTPRLYELVSMEAAPMMRDHAAQGIIAWPSKNHSYYPDILSLNVLIDGSKIPFPDKLHALLL